MVTCLHVLQRSDDGGRTLPSDWATVPLGFGRHLGGGERLRCKSCDLTDAADVCLRFTLSVPRLLEGKEPASAFLPVVARALQRRGEDEAASATSRRLSPVERSVSLTVNVSVI